MTFSCAEESFFSPSVHPRHRGKGAPVEESSGDRWVDEVVQLRPRRGGVRYLLRVKRERCLHCPSGVRTVSIWVTPQGRGEAVAWCGHCFNATCDSFPLDDEHRERFDAIREALSAGQASSQWNAARPALEDLERRGLL
jgi:hypothetical protein